MTASARRANRTRKLLQDALLSLLQERSYDAISVQEIVERADVGRTTFYAHYQSKEALFFAAHEGMMNHLSIAIPLDDLLAEAPSRSMVSIFEHAGSNRALFHTLTHSGSAQIILRGVRDQTAARIEKTLQDRAVTCVMPLSILASHLANTQLMLVMWWMDHHTPYTPEAMAQALHRLQQAVLRAALIIND
jgi:AcrR family transcriptional regulator